MSKTHDMIAGSLQELIDDYEKMGGKNSRMTRSASNWNRRKSSLRRMSKTSVNETI